VSISPSTSPAAGIDVAIQPGTEDYPGIKIAPDDKSWDLAPYGHIEALVVNTGAKPLSISLRVDDNGDWRDNPWDAESLYLQPGAVGTVKVIFGYSYGLKPGYRLKSNAVTELLLFAGKSVDQQSFRVESIKAAGVAGEMPPVDPDAVRTKPVDDRLLATKITLATQGASATSSQSGIKVLFSASAREQSVSIKPAIGRWDLRDDMQVRIHVQNSGHTPITPRARVESDGGASDWVDVNTLSPGTHADIIVPFAGATTAQIGKEGTGSRITSDSISAVTIAATNPEQGATLEVGSLRADSPNITLPSWLGKRPPIDGAWVKTLDDEFDGATLNRSLWRVDGPNYWDKQSHWSKDEVVLDKGAVALVSEKKRGFNDDNPAEKETAYAAGYLHTYNLWAQRYGYFEARMKLPRAPGLWPAFWLMPDRGPSAGDQGKRQDTGNGGMEFDIMEHLTRWGPHRYNIAMHYDGYGKDHKSVGSDKIYVQPDKNGYITCGLLWTPGLAVYYCNGKEVLRWENARISNVPEILMFTLPQGGWDNSPVDDTLLPDRFVIDYVRVWQRKDLASAADRPVK